MIFPWYDTNFGTEWYDPLDAAAARTFEDTLASYGGAYPAVATARIPVVDSSAEVILRHDFSLSPDGTPTTADTGQTWTQTGGGTLVVSSGLLLLSGTDTLSYMNADAAYAPSQITAKFAFATGTPNPEVAFIMNGEDSFTGMDLGLHVVLKPESITFHCREDGGNFDVVKQIAYDPELARNTVYTIVIDFAGDGVVNITDPLSASYSYTDERSDRLRGTHITLEGIRSTGTDPLGLFTLIELKGFRLNEESVRRLPFDLIDGTNVAVDASRSSTFRLTTTTAPTIDPPSNPRDGQEIWFEFTASGAARTITFDTASAGGFELGTVVSANTVALTADGKVGYAMAKYRAADDVWRLLVSDAT